MTVTMDTLVSLCKRRGFVFQSSEIYGGTGSCYDYGPLGVELKNNLKRLWWRDFVQSRPDMVGIDASILMHPTVWKASGHLDNFTDPMVDCRECRHRFRADKVDETPWVHYCPATKGNKFTIAAGEGCTHCGARRTLCPDCGKGELTPPRQFNLMFKTFMGPVEEEASVAYLRPETAQAMFVNFENVLQSMRLKLPFGIAQAGRSFRNEITPGNFIFRTREFKQMEMEYFVRPGEDEQAHQEWIDACHQWFQNIGISPDNLRLYEQPKEELAHYAKRTVDIQYRFFPEREDLERNWDELMGIANRTDFDLRTHSKKPEDAEGKRLNPDSTEDLSYFDEQAKQRFYPYVIEPAAGVNRTVLALLMDAYTEKTNDKGEIRVILKLHHSMAPIKVAVLPLAKNKPEIEGMAKAIKRSLQPIVRAVYDDTGGIGKLYARQDEIGTPFCVTVDHQSLEDEAVTVRDRDTWEQVRVKVADLATHLLQRFAGN